MTDARTSSTGDHRRDFFRDYFDGWGAGYGQYAFTGAGLTWLSQRELRLVLDAAGIRDGVRVLDAGCGTGRVSAVLRAAGGSVVSIDQAPSMVEATLASGQPEAYVAALGDPLPFDDGTFDAAVSVRVLKYLSDWQPALDEFARVIRPGGRLAIEVSNSRSLARWGYGENPVKLVTADEIRSWLNRAGFDVTSIVPVSHLPQKAFEKVTADGPLLSSVAVAQNAAVKLLGNAGARNFVVGATRRAGGLVR